MRALITGINGFVGPYLKKELERRGHEVFGIDLNDSDDAVSCNILNREEVNRVFSEVKPDRVFHLAAQSSVPKSISDPDSTFKINVEGTRNILEASLLLENKPSVLVVSSAQVYGKPVENPVSEKFELNPLSPYAISRIEQEELVLGYMDRLKVVIMRSFNHTGPGQSDHFVCSDWAKQAAEISAGVREAVIKVGNVDVERDFSDVRDIVRGYCIALEDGVSGEVYNIGSGRAVSLRRILDVLIGFVGKEVKIEVDSDRVRENDILKSYVDISKIGSLGWEPEISIEQTLKDLYKFWKTNI